MIFFGNSMLMTYIFREVDGKETEVALERWVWIVVYKDNTVLSQFGEDGIFHQIGEIEQDRVARAMLAKTDDRSQVIEIPWEDGMRIIHKYRNIVFNALSPEERRVRVYIFGWKKGQEHVYIFVLPDDRIIISHTDTISLEEYGV